MVATEEERMKTLPKYGFALREDIKDDKRFLPTRAEPKASGWDVRASFIDRQSLIIKPFQCAKIPLGFRTFCPDGWWFEIKPRSSTFVKKNLHSLYGTIDESYEGEAIFACQYIPEFNIIRRDEKSEAWIFGFPMPELTINFGDAIGQIIPIERQEMEVIDWSNEDYDAACKNRGDKRGTNGFGSTGA